MRADRNGLLYVIDRVTGEVLSATPFGFINSNRGVDMATGRLIPVDDKRVKQGVVVRDICPAAPGMKDWQPMSFSAQTGLLYIPHQNLCEDIEGMATSYIAGTPYVGASVVYKAGPGGHRGVVTAWDPIKAKAAWTITERFPVWSGTVATAGGLVFYGTMDGWFKAVDARTGQLLWQFKCGSGIIGQPIVYRGPDGREYVAILAGVGGWAGAIVVNDLDARDATAGNGFGAVMSDLKAATTRGGTLYVFALAGAPS
jgi:glucose dehydrogenase